MKRFCAVLLAGLLLWGGCPALAQSAPDSQTAQRYYNPQGGRYAHSDSYCTSVSEIYLPLSPMPGNLPEGLYSPCPFCAGGDVLSTDTGSGNAQESQGLPLIFSFSGGSGNLPNLQVEVYQENLEVAGWEGEQAYRIEIINKDQPTHVFTDLLFPSMEGGDELVPLVRLKDLNFDGYPDIETLRTQGASNVSSTFFLYSPTDGQFRYEAALGGLSAYALYPQEGFISNSIHDSAATGIRELYRIGENGKPIIYRRASILYEEQSNWGKIRIRVIAYDSLGGETILMDELREPFADDADYRKSEEKWLSLLYEGIPETVTKGDLGEQWRGFE